MNQHQQHIEALIFYRNEPVTYSWLAKELQLPEAKIITEIESMKDYYEGRGLALLRTDEEVSLVTSAAAKEVIAVLENREEERELSKQALETLAIVAYKGQITKPEIDYIRGVNSVFILRNLLMRGLVTKKQNLLDKRSPLYILTPDCLAHLNVTSREDLPGFQSAQERLNELEDRFHESQKETDPLVVGESEVE